MRCANWPDDFCRAPVACEAFGYCRERLWNHNGEPVNPEPHASIWKKCDDDGNPAGLRYGVKSQGA